MHGNGVSTIHHSVCVYACASPRSKLRHVLVGRGWKMDGGQRGVESLSVYECVIMTKHNSLRGVRLGVSATRHTHAQCTLCTIADGQFPLLQLLTTACHADSMCV